MFRNLSVSACAIAAIVASAAPTGAAAPTVQVASPAPAAPAAQHGIARFRVGKFEVVALSDGTLPLDVHPLLKGAPTARIDALLARNFERSPVETSINVFLVDTGSKVILVDAGAGELFGAYGGRLLNSLAAAGYRPEDVSDILLTHIHTDHSGGLTRRGQRLFPNATVHAGSADARFFLDGVEQGARPEARHHEEAMATVEPYRRAGKLALFTGPAELLPGVTALPAPGHTPGHSIYRVESGGESLEFWGDLIHVGAVQLPQPEITISFDVDQPRARRQRLSQFGRAAREGKLVAAAHLNFPGVGRLGTNGKGYDWMPAPHRLRD
jgi:glyoxylase-like metal-dependent hydrolase (beta-lactamase superfamily II)